MSKQTIHSVPGYEASIEHSGFAARKLPLLAQRGWLISPDEPITAQALWAHAKAHWPILGEPAQTDATAFAAALREFRNAALIAIMQRDLSRKAGFDETLQNITALADLTINCAYQSAMQAAIAQHGIPRDASARPQDLLIVGMGKLGGKELNASSDVDLIYVFSEEGETDASTPGSKSIDTQTFFTKVGRRIAALLGEITAEGIVFRVDLRLRPNGESGPLVCSLGMLEEYFIVQGREWERYAWIKARVVNQHCVQTHESFTQTVAGLREIVKPFVYRRYLDFNVLAALRDLHSQIRQEASRRNLVRESHMSGQYAPIDIKLGPGGIREVEFIGQLFQLIRGGKEEPLRARGTREVLGYLGKSGRLPTEEVEMLLSSYQFWRDLEHRLQYLEDAQTHVLPGKEDVIAHVGRSMGYASAKEFLDAIEKTQERVRESFERLFAGVSADESATPDAPQETKFEKLLKKAQSLAQQTADPEQTLARLRQLLETIGKRASYLALFDEYPNTFSRVAHVVSASAWASDYLRKHPIVLDELLDPRNLEAAPDANAVLEELRARVQEAVIDGEPDIERQMDALREVHHAYLFRLLVQDLDGKWALEKLSDHLSALADSVLQATLEATWRTIAKRHQEKPKFAVIAYGRLGGKELGYASDLDLIFLYDDAHESAPEIYARLAQRLNVWLSTATAAGTLFEIDLRLRPNGNAGLLVTDINGFIEYQQQHAWIWEHQALTRARFCAGDVAIGQAFEAERTKILRMRREPAALLEEVLAMRQKMHEGHPNATSLFDIKHDEGGMVDIEFLVQTLVLRFSHEHASLTGNLGNIALLRIAAELGLIDTASANEVANAYREYRRRQHAERLSGASSARVDPAVFENERQSVRKLWKEVFADAPKIIRGLQQIHDEDRPG